MKLLELFSNSIKKVDSLVTTYNYSEDEIIEQIHNEFDTAPERLIEMANKKLAIQLPDNSYIEDKGSRLRRLGFTSTEESKKLEQIESINKERELTKELADTVKYYQQNYPFSKFLTFEELERICEKYGLVHAPVSFYIKSVPDKNLCEIENAQELILGDVGKKHFSVNSWMSGFSFLCTEDILRIYPQYYNLKVSEFMNNILSISIDLYNKGYERPVLSEKSKFQIAAPATHFDLSRLEKDSKFGYRTPIIKNDPIVFRYCRGGVLIDSKWGTSDDKSSNDPVLLNPINN